MSTVENHSTEMEVLQAVIDQLSKLDDDGKQRVLQYATTLFKLAPVYQQQVVTHHAEAGQSSGASITSNGATRPFSDRSQLSPKEFLLEKEPRTEVERVACLAYYLTHYRDTPHFKTLDISSLNTEAAQPKFSNAAYTVDNATRAGFLVPAIKGLKQLSAMGERFIQALPDRDAANTVRERHSKRARRSNRSSNSGAEE